MEKPRKKEKKKAGARPRFFFEEMFTLGHDGPTVDIHDLLGIKEEEELPWRVLGLRGSTDRETATKAYRKLCWKYHPDRGGSSKKMIELNTAWDRIRKSKGW